MKKRIIMTAILVILSGSSYSLQAVADTADVYQRGNSNTVTVTQSGLLDSTAAIDQNGNDIATITQVGTGGAGANKVDVVQDGTATGTGNTTTINQKAGGNTVSVYQSSLTQPNLVQPFATVGMGDNTGGTAVGNRADVTQNGIDNTLASIAQVGNNNIATLVQDSGNSGSIIQTGNTNTASISQGAATGTASKGVATVLQQGINGSATVLQMGLANFNNATVTQDLSSSGVTASVTQSGTYNLASVTQKNSFSSAIVDQSGAGSSGLGINQVTITQEGIGLSGMGDTATATQLIGDANMITINQSRGDGSSVTVTQNGSGNTATMMQNQ